MYIVVRTPVVVWLDKLKMTTTMLQCVQGNREANDNQQIVCGKKLDKQRDLWLPH